MVGALVNVLPLAATKSMRFPSAGDITEVSVPTHGGPVKFKALDVEFGAHVLERLKMKRAEPSGSGSPTFQAAC